MSVQLIAVGKTCRTLVALELSLQFVDAHPVSLEAGFLTELLAAFRTSKVEFFVVDLSYVPLQVAVKFELLGAKVADGRAAFLDRIVLGAILGSPLFSAPRYLATDYAGLFQVLGQVFIF